MSYLSGCNAPLSWQRYEEKQANKTIILINLHLEVIMTLLEVFIILLWLYYHGDIKNNISEALY